MSIDRVSVGITIIAFALTAAAAANAQVSAGQSSPAADSRQVSAVDDGLPEVLVTAQRREESAQDVPIAVAAFSGDEMTKVGLVSSADLASVIPGLSINPTGVRSPLFLRGVGNNGTSTTPSVLAFIDGVYQPFDATGADFSNVQSIEVAKGPQGTLFGRNATGGVIQITTKNPFDWQGLDAQVGYGNYKTSSGKVYGSMKLSEKLAADVAAFYDNQAEGWGVSRNDGAEMYTARRYGVRSKWVARIDDSFTATFTGDYAYRWGQVGVGISPPVGTGFLYNAVTDRRFTLPSYYDVTTDYKPYYQTDEGGAALTLEKHWGDVQLLSISSYRRVNEVLRIDFDGNQFPFFELSREDRRKAFTQELQLSGSGTGLNWVGGLYYFNMKSAINGPRFSGIIASASFGFGTAPGVPFAISSDDKTDALAAYVQMTKAVFASTNLTLGARYTTEKRQISGQTTGSPFLSPGSAGTERATFKKPNYRVALDHKFTPDVLGYVSWNRGFNAGFFNQISVPGFNYAVNPVVNPEEIDAYEIGLKSDLLDRHLRVNIAAFQYNYSNLQQQIYQFGGISSLNAAKARIKGVDLDVVTRPMRNLTLTFGANYLDPKYLSYPLAVNYDFAANGSFNAVGARDAAGKELVGAPKVGLQLTGTYTHASSVGSFDTTVHVNYQSKMYADAQNEYVIPARTLVGLTEQWTSRDGRTYFTVWGKNLTDEVYDVSLSLLAPVGLVGNPGAPRTFGVTIGHRF
jgi:iron complex outermembrane recepter protein